MTIRALISTTVLLTFLTVGCTSVHGGSSGESAPTAPAANAAPVVLELFTSQGCSSCPPADRVLSMLGSDPSLHERVIPLAFHVDYWNSIGWTDPFSSAAWSERQSAYAKQFALDSVYTPQIVVNGHDQLNGSDEDGIRRAIDAAAAGPAGRLTVTTKPDGPDRLVVDVTAETPTSLGVGSVDAFVAVYETGLVTSVMRGENSGRELHDDFVVRRLDRVFGFEPSAGATKSGRLTIALDGGWHADRLGIVAFLQDPRTLRVYGASVR